MENEIDLKKKIEDVFTSLNIPEIGRVGKSGLYYLGYGTYTNELGWIDFQNKMKEENGKKERRINGNKE